jgi:hypothetical protein
VLLNATSRDDFACCRAIWRCWQILLQKWLAMLLNDDSVALTRFAAEAIQADLVRLVAGFANPLLN